LGSQAGSTQSVVVLLSDASGKETFHTFEVAVVGAAPGVASTPRPPRPEPRPPVVPRPAPAAVAPAAAPPGAAAPRTWTDATGAFEIEAVYLGFSAGVVRLRRSDGREVAVPLEKLSQADQGYVRRMAKP